MNYSMYPERQPHFTWIGFLAGIYVAFVLPFWASMVASLGPGTGTHGQVVILITAALVLGHWLALSKVLR
jgi:hypothetical protein